MKPHSTVTNYIDAQSTEYQFRLTQIRDIIHEVVPEAAESISYGMPGYTYCARPLIYFTCAKNHTGFYPAPSAIIEFARELQEYKTSKGSIQFLHSQELPLQLIRKIVEFRVQENKNF